ncbi:MAG TPA: fatty acid--CoA ligase family protein, partial [Terriglobales bacterium]|nr:fatty acid--CoA ligase family protein [Terriglobales bacterium]
GLKNGEVSELVSEMGLDAICCSPSFAGQIPEREHASLICADLLQGKSPLLIQACRQRLADERDRQRLIKLGAPMIRFTSGTTSRSKGVIIPQSSMVEYTKRFATVYGIKRGDCVLNLLSMPHIFYQVTTAFLKGMKLLVEDATQIESIGSLLGNHRVTHIEAAPTFYRMLLAAGDLPPKAVRHVRYFTSCGAPLKDAVAASFRERFRREIVQRYGLTETGPVLVNTSEDPSKRGSLGAPAPGCEVRLAGDMSKSNERSYGEILVRCPGLFHGYYRPWTPQHRILKRGWFATGDLGKRDKDGYFWIAGRTKTVINVGAVKVFPDEIEDLLLSHPEIDEAFVYGAPDPRFGEAPHAKVKLAPGSASTQKELLRFANRRLSVFKALRHIEFVDAIPKTLTGKIKRQTGRTLSA